MPRQPGVPRPELKDLTSFITVTKGRAKIDTDNVDVDFCIAVADRGATRSVTLARCPDDCPWPTSTCGYHKVDPREILRVLSELGGPAPSPRAVERTHEIVEFIGTSALRKRT
jgi:hypothetical protein